MRHCDSKRKRRLARVGMTSLEAALFIGSVFIVAMLMYWLAQASFVGLLQVFSSHIGSPYF